MAYYSLLFLNGTLQFRMHAEVLEASNPDGSLKYEQYQLRTKELLAKKDKKLRGC